MIVDRNGHPVPDGTPVRFFFQYDGDAAPKIQEAKTLDGVARTEFVLSKVGRLLIRASERAGVEFDRCCRSRSARAAAMVATVVPTPTPTPTRFPTATRTPTLTPTPTVTPLPGPMETFLTRKPQNAQWGELILALIGVAVIGGGGYWADAPAPRMIWRTRCARALWTVIGGLIGYVYFTLGLARQ